MRDAGRDEHERTRAAGDERLAHCRFPPVPITDGTVDRLERQDGGLAFPDKKDFFADGTVDRLERQDVELAFHDIEDFFADGVHMRADIKSRSDDDLERRCRRRIVHGHLDCRVETAPGYPAPRTGWQDSSGRHQARVAILVIGRVVMIGGVAPGGMAGRTWEATQALWAASDSHSSVTW